MTLMVKGSGWMKICCPKCETVQEKKSDNCKNCGGNMYELLEKDKKFIKHTRILKAKLQVSTVNLVFEHGNSMFFETMIFPIKRSGEIDTAKEKGAWRYPDRKLALENHKKIVKGLRSLGREWLKINYIAETL